MTEVLRCFRPVLLACVSFVVATNGWTDVLPQSAKVDVRNSLGSAPWFDSETGEIKPIEVVPRDDDSIHRDSRWMPKPKKLKQPKTTTTNNTGGGGPGVFGSSWTFTNLLGWVLIFVLVVAIVGAITYAISRSELQFAGANARSNNGKSKSDLPDEDLLERIKHLPPELRRTDVNLRTECERLMNAGRFDQAIILLLGHQLLLLDRIGLLRLSRGKTNGRYVRETRTNDRQCGDWLRETADAFEQSYFGRHEIPREAFTRLWGQNEQLESAVNTIGASQ
ncbi:MAG: DUF4129 domain-containing protein [Planctomycetota bacterium]